ncbi:STAS domain-containing protein [Plantactinospora solaniradicis]|uniref:STAS domain-containing protein n=1 Tax=Plantactinospora solaniradicis TaxID=1723736 RepID=A0ABW1KQK2_9ACTN
MTHATQGGTMPQNSDGFYQESDHGLTLTARTLPGGDRRTYLCLAGEIDIASSAVLSKAVDWLTALGPVIVLVDLAELTFACSTLSNFVVRVRQSMPDDAELILWRARPATEWMLRVTDMATIATIRDEAQ